MATVNNFAPLGGSTALPAIANNPQAAAAVQATLSQLQQVLMALELGAAGMASAQQLGQGFQGVMQGGPAGAGGVAPVGAASGNPAGGAPKVVVIDDFSSSHGQEISNQIASGGVNTQNLDISRGDQASNISNALDQVIAQVQAGGSVDAVNISQQNFDDNASTQAVKQKIDQLQKLGVPVVVAAGNAGKDKKNQLAGNAQFVVENGSANSGRGNVRSQGEGTSQAAANVSIQVARRHHGG